MLRWKKIQMVSKTCKAIHFARSQKVQYKYIVSKILSALETFPYKYEARGEGGGWIKNVLGGKKLKN